VNLGCWLVLEKWMDPGMFAGSSAEDETWLNRELGSAGLRERMLRHRSTYITEEDFAAIAGAGLDFVRIPVPYFVFGDREPYDECVTWLDKAFVWARRHGLKVLIDLHTAPGGQNGYDNGGIMGVCRWHTMPSEVEFVLTVLERLAVRYGDDSALMGIEVLNEPISLPVYLFAPSTGKAADKAEAAGSGHVPTAFLKDFYRQAYVRLRRILPSDKLIVFHDGFRLHPWTDFFRDPKLKNVMLDIHPYIWALEMYEPVHAPWLYRIYLRLQRARIRKLQKRIPVLVGEWTACSRYAADMKQTGRAGTGIFAQKRKRCRRVAAMEMDTWSEAAGWCYWSWKLYPDGRYRGKDSWKAMWDMSWCIRHGFLPDRF